MSKRMRLLIGLAVIAALAGAIAATTSAQQTAAGPAKQSADASKPCCVVKAGETSAACPLKKTEDGWLVLFDGTNLDCWQNARKPGAENKWSIDGDAITNAPHGNDIATKCALKDFELQLEFKIVPQGNSGVYLRGRIEVQVLDSFGKTQVDKADNGGIYDKFAPLVNASKPAGEWNQLEAHYVGDTLTVKLNGQVVIDNQKIAELTGGALPGGVDDPGPLMLQGDHGKVWYRNIKVRPL